MSKQQKGDLRMNNYKVQVRLPNGAVTFMNIQARSMSEAREIAKAYGQVIIIYHA